MNLNETFVQLQIKNVTNAIKGHFETVCQSAKKLLHTLGDEENFNEEESYDITDEKTHTINTDRQLNGDQVLSPALSINNIRN